MSATFRSFPEIASGQKVREETAAAYMRQRAELVTRVIELSKHSTWDGYAASMRDLNVQIARIDEVVGPQLLKFLENSAKSAI